jgi:23S rRNA (cytosine1962-C5)-methyltransferase
MFDPDEYELLDFSRGEKLERFGNVIVRRQTPSVPDQGKRIAENCHQSQLRFKRNWSGGPGRWTGDIDLAWSVAHLGVNFQLRPTPTGQVGIFPEQVSNWDWIHNSRAELKGCRAINLFGYTGGTTLALARAGVSVTHVDSAKTAVSWARENATSSQLQNHPIRWITEDAMRFAKRELKRGNQYDIFVADPPSFGRGPGGETWKLERDLPELLATAARLTANRTALIIISCHTPGYDAARLGREINQAWKIPSDQIDIGSLALTTDSGRQLPCGQFARWQNPHLNQE